MVLIAPIKTERIEPGSDLYALLARSIEQLQEGDILAVTSKIVSLCEGRIASKTADKQALIRQEAEKHVEIDGMIFTQKHGLLIPAAGIDESNIPGGYLLYPKDPMQSAYRIWQYLQNRFSLTSVGVVITDSRSQPLRRGTTGVSIAWCGFKPLDNCIGRPDLYGRPLKVTMRNIVDGIAAAAVLVMGEAAEQTPLVKISNLAALSFVQRAPSDEELAEFFLKTEEDLYQKTLPFFAD